MDTIAKVLKCSKFELTDSLTSKSVSEVDTFVRKQYFESADYIKPV